MGEEGAKPWKKTDDIPRRFDELPPEPEWVPVAEVIRTHRQDEAQQEAKKDKIKPPEDSDSEAEATQRSGSKTGKIPKHKANVGKKKHTPSKKSHGTSMPPTVDDVTQAMVDWALNIDHYPRKTPRSTHHKHYIERLEDKQKPGLPQEKRSSFGMKPVKISKDGKNSHMLLNEFDDQPDILSSSGGHRSQGDSTGAPRTRGQPPISNQKQQRPPYDEPSPDYDDEEYDAYFSRYEAQYYPEGDPNENVYYYDDHRYDDSGVMDPYLYGSASPYKEFSYCDPQPGYSDHNLQDDYRYEYGGPQYPHEGQRSSYPHSLPYHGPVSQEYPRGPQRSSYDVLY